MNLRSDPFERADKQAANYAKWRVDRAFLLVPAQQYVGQYIATFKEFPPSQKVGSFSLDQVLENFSRAGAAASKPPRRELQRAESVSSGRGHALA